MSEQDLLLQEAQQALRVSEERYRRIVETTDEGVMTVDRDMRLDFVNARCAEMFGYTREELLGRSVYDLLDPADREPDDEKLQRRKQGLAETYQRRYLRKDGSELWALVRAHPLMDAEGRFEGTLAMLTDVSARRHDDEMRSRLAAIVESSDDAILGTDLEGNITAWNRGAERLYGYSREEMVGQSLSLLVPPEGERDHLRVMGRVLRGEAVHHQEATRRRKDGTLVEVSLTVSPIRDRVGRILGLSKIAHDLTEKRRADAQLASMREQLWLSQKMEAIGNLAGGVAHDFNNLLSVILSYTALALEELKPGEALHDDLSEVEKAAQRAASLTQQLLAFGRRQILAPQVLDLNHSVRGLEKILRRVLGEHISLALHLESKLGQVYADPGQIEQVLMNLVVNARDAMPDGGMLTIETLNVELDASYAAQHVEVTPGEYVMVAVTDSGVGMDAATRARMFEPFFTTKEPGRGTGLGLSTVFGIVKQSDGHIWAYSEPGEGTTFKVYLPRSDGAQHPVTATPPPSPPRRGTETVLVVEDDPAVRTIVQTILRRQGYNVLEGQNGGDALLICEQYGGRIDLLITDVVMPRMNGRQLATRLASIRPELKVLYISGYTEDTIVHHGILDAGIAYLAKPITPEALARKVRDVLDGPR
jgi:two-component system cell cycle sensor histidine kinase/response regulator CckA